MKLFQLYKDIVDRIKPIEVAWFTTFNLDADLTERFLLSYLVGKAASELKTAEDFEGLNLELQGMDIKVWHDYRAMNRRMAKRTTIDMLSVDPKVFYNSSSADIVFHPKVIFLFGQGGAYLITGSANLSIAAWSTNKEGILAKAIQTRSNGLEMLSFFRKLFDTSSIQSEKIVKLESWVAKLPNEDSDWSFFHSFDARTSLFDQFKPDQLTIWSPYFSRKSSDLFEALIRRGFHHINVVPDIAETGKIRVTPEELTLIHTNTNLRLSISKESAERKTNNHRLSHAKVWMTPTQLAVGSWNCSYRATGLDTARAEQNIEAGIITALPNKDYHTLSGSIRPVGIDSIRGMDENELDAEWEEVLNPFTVDCKLIADWATFTYDYVCVDPTGLTISLPDKPTEKFSLPEIRGKSFLEHYKRVLKDKTFTVYNFENQVVYEGVILETGKQKRQAYSYITFFDLFDSLLQDPAGETPRKLCQYRLDDEMVIEEEREELKLQYKGHESYYMMFVAFQKLFDAIESHRQNAKKLDEIGFRLPGSLTNISNLLRETLEEVLKDTDEDKLVFYYFLGLELNRCIIQFNEYNSQAVPEVEIEHVFARCNAASKDVKFVRALKVEFDYET